MGCFLRNGHQKTAQPFRPLERFSAARSAENRMFLTMSDHESPTSRLIENGLFYAERAPKNRSAVPTPRDRKQEEITFHNTDYGLHHRELHDSDDAVYYAITNANNNICQRTS